MSSLDRIITALDSYAGMQLAIRDAGKIQVLHQLQHWQCQRLLATHAQLKASRRFKPAMAFFVDELYGPKDFSERDQQIAKIAPKMATLLPERALTSLATALELNTLSLDLDIRLMEALPDDCRLDKDHYAKAYISSATLEERILQIDTIDALGHALADVVKIPGISAVLFMARKPAEMAGVGALHEFLASGFKAFKKIGQVEDFIQPVVEAERELCVQLFQSNINPLPDVSL